jgi:transposase
MREGKGSRQAQHSKESKLWLGQCHCKPLLPALKPGQVVVMASLWAHKGSNTRELIETQGCELLFLSPYLPNLNPIEEAFGKP